MTDYQRGCVDTANRIRNRARHLSVMDNCTEMLRETSIIIAENTPNELPKKGWEKCTVCRCGLQCGHEYCPHKPKKSEAEIFYDKHQGKVVKTKGGIIGELDAYDEFDPKLHIGWASWVNLSDITHVYEPIPVEDL